jgi:Glycosyl hydrolase family 59
MRLHSRLLLSLLIAAGSAHAGAARPVILTIDPQAPGKVFDGIGATSAGIIRLLIDYPEPQRSQILDYLFKPKYGASLQQLKVEIGGDGNSNAGSEPSSMHSRDDVNFARGVGWWLMREARRRNPQIRLSALAWNFPGWVERGYSPATVEYLTRYIEGAQRTAGIRIDYVGIWNETRIGSEVHHRSATLPRPAGAHHRDRSR